MRDHLLIVAVSALSIAAACGHTTPSAEVASVEPLTPWSQLDQGQKLDRMKTVVLPRMKTMFQKHDAIDFAKFDCATCHGDGATQGRFKMPNAALPALNPADGFNAHMNENPSVTKFMMHDVVPEMAKALGETPYDPSTGQGFGCFECHTKAE